MNPEAKINDCEFCLNQLKHFESDPYYTRYFFDKYLEAVTNFYQEIFGEANRDFGLFIKEKHSRNKFEEKAKEKKDDKALEFVEWFDKRFHETHVNVFPKFLKMALNYYKKNKSLDYKIMLRAKERYENDIFQEIKVTLRHGKIRSNEELKIEVQRQLPVFLDIINYKRQKNNEPKIDENQVKVSIFTDIEKLENMEIVYACEIYIPLMKQFIISARNKIKNLTQFN